MGCPASEPRARAARNRARRTSTRRTTATIARTTTAAPRIKVIDRHPAEIAGANRAAHHTSGANRCGMSLPGAGPPGYDGAGARTRPGGQWAMLRILGSRKKLCDGLTRRDFLCAGGLSLFGLGL